MNDDYHALHQWLNDACRTVARLEERAQHSVAQDNIPEYVAAMHEKAQFLAQLAQQGEPLTASLPVSDKRLVQERLERFSYSAQRALELDSVFYMSALLFPENHTPGQPNDLELFAAEIRDR